MPASLSNPTGDFARFLRAAGEPAARWQRGVDRIVDLVRGCDHAGVTAADDRTAWTVAATDEVVTRGDALQYEFGEGPCLDTVRLRDTVTCPDLRNDRRWPRWSPKVVDELGVRAMLALPLSAPRGTMGALNLYGDHPDPWDREAVEIAHALADHLAAAVGDALEIEQRGRAMTGRTVIGQSQGILMERFGIDADTAFEYLRRMSQQSNRKLLAIAEDIVATRRLPGQHEDRADPR